MPVRLPPPLTPSIIRRQAVLEEHDLATDGARAVVVVRTVAGTTYRSHLWLVALDRKGTRRQPPAPLQLTRGAVRDGSPRFSPDGRRLAFLRRFPDEPDRPAAVMVAELAGGEPWSLVSPPHGASEIAWAPGSDRLAVVAGADPARFIVGPETKGRAPLARRIRRADWRWDEIGHRDRWDHLWVVPARPGGRLRQLTRGDFDVRGPAWSPDGRTIAFAADRRPDAELHPAPAIWSAPAAGGEPALVLDPGGPASQPAWSPDGRWLACIAQGVPLPLDDVSPTVFVGPADGTGPAIALAPELDRPVGPWLDTDLNGWMVAPRSGPVWAGDDTILALVADRGRCVPWRFWVDSSRGRPAGPPERLVEADAACWTLAAGGLVDGDARAPVVSVVGTLDGRAMELMTVEGTAARAHLRTWTALGSRWQRRARTPLMRNLLAPGPGGSIECWLASPPDAGEAMLPTVVNVHGGPLGAWAPAPSIETSLLVSRGYRVLLPNIRGSTGYGRDWIRPQLGDWGGVDAADVHAALDHVIDLGLADPGRLGVLGLSYGGFMANWLVATSSRFQAAVSENGVANQVSSWANSDSGVEYNRAALLGDVLSEEGVARLWRQSPLAHVSDVRTPLLILQAEADRRCPAADSEQFFVALRELGREVEYVLYPDEFHIYAITGRPDRRIDRMTRMLDWFDAHLKS